MGILGFLILGLIAVFGVGAIVWCLQSPEI